MYNLSVNKLLTSTEFYPFLVKINGRFTFVRRALWKWNGTDFEEIITDIDQMVWDKNGVWYIPMLDTKDFILVGSKEEFDGAGTSMYDFIRTWTGEVIYHNLETGEETVYCHENVNLKIEPIGVSNGYIIAAVNDYSTLTIPYEKVNLKPEPDGTISVYGAIKARTEENE